MFSNVVYPPSEELCSCLAGFLAWGFPALEPVSCCVRPGLGVKMGTFRRTYTNQKHGGCDGPHGSAVAATDLIGVWLRGATPRPGSGAATESARLQRHRSGLEELPHVPGQGRWLRGATPHPRSSSCTGPGGPVLHLTVRRGSREEIPLLQGKRNQSKTVVVARGHQRVGTLKA